MARARAGEDDAGKMPVASVDRQDGGTSYGRDKRDRSRNGRDARCPSAARVDARPPTMGSLYRFRDISDTKLRQKLDISYTAALQLLRRVLV